MDKVYGLKTLALPAHFKYTDAILGQAPRHQDCHIRAVRDLFQRVSRWLCAPLRQCLDTFLSTETEEEFGVWASAVYLVQKNFRTL